MDILQAMKQYEDCLLKTMGFETAKIHLGSKQAILDIRRDLQSRPGEWLLEAAKEMVKITTEDWEDWRSRCSPNGK